MNFFKWRYSIQFFILGIGFGMMYLPSIVSVGLYFDKKRSLATGIAVCGSGIGTFIFSPVLEFLSEIYNWRGVLMIVAGIILNGAVCGMLIRPLKPELMKTKGCKPRAGGKTSNKSFYDKNGLIRNDSKMEACPFLEDPKQQENNRKDSVGPYRSAKSLNDISTVPQYSNSTCKTSAHKRDIDGNLLVIPQFQSLQTFTFTTPEKLTQTSTCLGRISGFVDNIGNILKEMFDLSLLLNTSFVLICIGNIFGASAYYITFMYLVDRALLLGISSTNAAFLLSTIGKFLLK